MAHSGDKNGSNHSDVSGSMQAEQILDSIIEHIESTDEPMTADSVETDENAMSTGAAIENQQENQSMVRDATANFKDIEKRAADLALRLGGAGLSFNLGAKKHLAGNHDKSGMDDPQTTTVATAIIHDDDLDTDSKQFGISPDEELRVEDIQGREMSRQELHVNEWAAELNDDRGVEMSSPAINPAEVELVEGKISSWEPQPNVLPESGLNEPQQKYQELQDIEAKIEELSSSLKVDDGLIPDLEENVLDLVQDTPVHDNVSYSMEQRVNTLEAHIVKLLDDISLSEQKLTGSVSDIVKSEMQNAVREAIENSEFIGELKSEMARAVEQRNLQENHMTDSLDALHDALKDVGERVKSIESVGGGAPQRTAEEYPSESGIVSSVLGSRLAENQPETIWPTVEQMDEGDVPRQRVRSEAAEDLPTWLSDATDNLHGNHLDIPEELPDVFASSAMQQEQTEEYPVVEEAVESSSPIENQPVQLEPEVLVDELTNDEFERVSAPVTYDEEIVEDVETKPEHSNEAERDQLGAAESLEHQNAAHDKNNFLRSARAAARAANDRSAVDPQEETDTPLGDETKSNSANFIAAAKQKDLGEGTKLVPGRMKNTSKNSLFSDKVKGPNSLLVFTSLILFGTSAMLLYGMSKNNTNGGSVVKLNAIEKPANPQAPVSEMGSSDFFPPVVKMNTSSISRGQKGQGSTGERRNAEPGTSIVIAEVTLDVSDTLSNMDKKDASRLASTEHDRSSVEFTAAIPDIHLNKTNTNEFSLFDQYSSFSALSSGASGPMKPASKSSVVNPELRGEDDVSGLLSSAKRGDFEAQYEVARRYGKGIGVRRSPAISVEWYEKSANAGYAPAIYRLATMYERGKGVTKDYKRAMGLYISAAKKGNVKAMHNLAVLYTGGNLGKADYKNAINWYEQAAQYGVKDSQFNLAIIYQNGMGGVLDLEKAFKWYSLAARAGDKEAKEMVKDIRGDLTSVQQEKLERIIRNWKAKTPDKSANAVSQYRKASLVSVVKKNL